jgi:hypothetical protein
MAKLTDNCLLPPDWLMLNLRESPDKVIYLNARTDRPHSNKASLFAEVLLKMAETFELLTYRRFCDSYNSEAGRSGYEVQKYCMMTNRNIIEQLLQVHLSFVPILTQAGKPVKHFFA